MVFFECARARARTRALRWLRRCALPPQLPDIYSESRPAIHIYIDRASQQAGRSGLTCRIIRIYMSGQSVVRVMCCGAVPVPVR